MKQEIAVRWVKALRSGEYKQGQFALRRANSYCCLGVLCDLHFRETGKYDWLRVAGTEKYSHCGSTTLPVQAVREWSGLGLSDAGLATMNDQRSFDFVKIADYIEQNWEQL